MGRSKRPESMVMNELKEGQTKIYRMLLHKLEKYNNKPNVQFDINIQNMVMTINNTTNSFSGLMKTIHLSNDIEELERIVNSIPPEIIAKYTQRNDSINPEVLIPDPLA